MSGIVGGCMTCSGVLKIFDVLSKATTYLGKEVHLQRVNDNKCKQIMRIAANVFTVIGHFTLGIGMIAMGAALYAASPGVAFMVSFTEGLTVSAPYLITSLATSTLGLMIRQIVR